MHFLNKDCKQQVTTKAMTMNCLHFHLSYITNMIQTFKNGMWMGRFMFKQNITQCIHHVSYHFLFQLYNLMLALNDIPWPCSFLKSQNEPAEKPQHDIRLSHHLNCGTSLEHHNGVDLLCFLKEAPILHDSTAPRLKHYQSFFLTTS